MVTHQIANLRLLVKGYARSSRASVATTAGGVLAVVKQHHKRVPTESRQVFGILGAVDIVP